MPETVKLQKESIVYRYGNLVLWPYPDERTLASAYLMFDKQDLLKVIYYSGPITLSNFVMYLSKPEVNCFGCYREKGDGTMDIVGLIWLNQGWAIGANWRGKEACMSFFRGNPTEDLVLFGQMAIEWAYDRLNLDNILGVTPVLNRAAVLYGKKIGFEQFGPIPDTLSFQGRLCGAIIQTMTKAAWKRLSPFRSLILDTVAKAA